MMKNTQKELDALRLLIELKDYYGLQDWSAGFNNRVHSMGLTKFRKKHIELSRNLIKHASEGYEGKQKSSLFPIIRRNKE